MTNPMKINVLITGASGNLGSKLSRRLLGDPKCGMIFGIDPVANSFELQNEKRYQSFSISLSEVSDLLIEVVQSCDVIVHFAAINPQPEATWLEASESFDMTAVLVHLASLYCKRFVFASSNHVLGGYKDSHLGLVPGALSHKTLPNPGTKTVVDGVEKKSLVYAASKLMGERICHCASEISKLESICIRIGWCLPEPNDPRRISASGSLFSVGENKTETASRDLTWFRNMWLSDRDFVETFAAAVTCDSRDWPARSITLNAVSANTGSPWNLENNLHLIGYQPKDNVESWLSGSKRKQA